MRSMLSLLFLFLFVGFAHADEYYCMFFATDSIRPRYCHVWGTFAQIKENKLIKEVTISWTPEGRWNILDRRKTGYHMTLEDSMNDSGNIPTCIWGPFEIEEDLFKKAEIEYQSSGDYKMIDCFSRPTAINCIHKLCEITGKRKVTHIRYGKFAASAVHQHYKKQGLLYQPKDREVVLNALGLKRYKLRYR